VFGSCAAGATAAPAVRVISGDRSIGGLAVGPASPIDAVSRLGAPSSKRPDGPQGCVLHWQRLGLTLEFLDLDGGDACTKGGLVTATVTDRSRWRSALGLRVGDGVARVRALYPGAVLHAHAVDEAGYWLVTRHACAEVGGSAFPGLLARVQGGRVSAFRLNASVCE
jgi:hypothetical protein